MIYILLAACFFGLVHPGSKFFLDSGLDIVSFCLLYVGFRLLAQFPILLFKCGSFRQTRNALGILIAIGLVGAALQLAEFFGIAKGLPVSLVTFLVYTHPLWSLIFTVIINREPFRIGSVFPAAIGLMGIFAICGIQSPHYPLSVFVLFAPLCAAMLIALWVSLSNRAKKLGLSSWTISFYYDLFALLALLIVRFFQTGNSSISLLGWILQGRHYIWIGAYSILGGLVPNLLFYYGNTKSSARKAGLVLLLEPLLASGFAHLFFAESLSSTFLLGAAAILLAALPSEVWGSSWLQVRKLVA